MPRAGFVPDWTGVPNSESGLAQAVEQYAYAIDHVPFWGKRAAEDGVRPADVDSPEAFRRITATSKADYRVGFPHQVLARDATLADPFIHKSQSSGSGGERLTTVAYTYELAERMEQTMSVHPPLLGMLEGVNRQRVVRYAAPNCSDVECATPNSTMADRILPDGTLVLPVLHDLLATPASMVDQAIQEMLDYDPDWLYVDSTHLAFLCRAMRSRGLAPPPARALILTYTRVLGVDLRFIDAYFPSGTEYAEVVSMTELGWVVMGCPHGRTHLNTSTFFAELLDPEGQPVAPGELGELHLTSLNDELCPHIRYQTGDVYVYDEGGCACGHEFPVVHHHGRWSDMVVDGDRILCTPLQAEEIVGDPGWLTLYKLHQLDPHTVHLYLLPSPQYHASDEAELEERFASRLGRERLRTRVVDHIATERSGKFTACVSDVADRPAGRVRVA